MKYILLLLLLFFSCTKNEVNKETIVLPLSSDISSLDPAVAFDSVSLQVVYQIYETLYQYDYNNPTKIIPLLAESMPKVSEDQLIYTIKIKKGIKYHPHPLITDKDRIVKAQDFITQIKRLAFLPTKGQGFWLFDGKVKGINQFREEAGEDLGKMLEIPIEGIKVIDDQTFSIELLKPYPQMIYALTMAFVTPIPEEVVIGLNNNLTNEEVGTGPYYLEKIQRSHKIKISHFKKYHNSDLPKTSVIEYPIMKEAQTRWLNFLKNKVDFFGMTTEHFNVALDKDGNLKEEFKDKGFELKKTPSMTYWWISFNMQNKIVGSNKNLRLAIAHATNQPRFIEKFTNNTGIKANSIYHPSVYGYDKNSELPYSYNIEKAKKYLKDAGYPNGKGLPVLNFDTRSNDNSTLKRAEFIKAELAKIGINIKVIANNFPTFLQKAKKGELQFWQDGWALDYPDSENILQLLYSENHPPGINSSYYNNPEVDKLIQKVSILENNLEKKILMTEIEKKVLGDVVWIMQFYSQSYMLHHNKIKNYKPSSLVNNSHKYFEIQDSK